ncbi:hypothetical protein MNEG_0541 [Monoraphidium neglectum]|uniref:Chitin-binding type-4 domain-containing protein n=1 Tax=Monoraphidium neglectum TaxID=145388 RepID=A0A0D2MY48_9CHLO|nr:hypothetical protein MNEG_0541 [Monoraphidium neglectum]KIZ07405.1 hypothetical protein MNEG_0541 [Monoraphidium neglectum]|eukprot:XP_013906424.1 hypothetical protein MNEG_0541 [Monoraphidium neglectum]
MRSVILVLLAAVALAATASATDCTVMPGCTACTDFIPNITAPGAASHQIHKSFHGLRRLLQPSSGEGSRGGPDALEGSDGPDGSDGSDDVDGPSSLSSPRSSSGRTSKIRGHRDSFGNFSGPTFAPNFTRITCTACDTAGYKLDAQKGVACADGYVSGPLAPRPAIHGGHRNLLHGGHHGGMFCVACVNGTSNVDHTACVKRADAAILVADGW